MNLTNMLAYNSKAQGGPFLKNKIAKYIQASMNKLNHFKWE
jgi:hypothetical protein